MNDGPNILITHQNPVIVMYKGSSDSAIAKTVSNTAKKIAPGLTKVDRGQSRVHPMAKSRFCPRHGGGRGKPGRCDLRGEKERRGRVLGSGSPGDEQSVLWWRACPPLRYLGQGDYPPRYAPASWRWRCCFPV